VIPTWPIPRSSAWRTGCHSTNPPTPSWWLRGNLKASMPSAWFSLTRLDVNGVVRRRLGARKVSFAPAELTIELTGQEIGGVTVFGLPDKIPVWVDARVLEPEWVVIGAGSRSAKIKLDPQVLASLDRFEVVEGLAKLPEHSG
jgi:hypothetical protein